MTDADAQAGDDLIGRWESDTTYSTYGTPVSQLIDTGDLMAAEIGRLRAAVADANQRAEQAENLLDAADVAVTALLTAIEAEQPGFVWSAERTADAIDRLTKIVLPLGALVADQPALCENCGKPMAAHDHLARCYPALVADQPDPDPAWPDETRRQPDQEHKENDR